MNHEHIVKSYYSELTRLYGEITRMGEIAAAQLEAAIDALGRRDSKAAQRVVANDVAIDELEQEVSQDVLRLLALRQPMARDLRLDHPAHLENAGGDAAQLGVELGRNVTIVHGGSFSRSVR